MEASLLALVVPGIVSAITGGLKMLPTFTSLSDSSRTPTVRMMAALLSLLSILLLEWVGGAFDANTIQLVLQTFLLSAATWVASLGIFHGIFQAKTVVVAQTLPAQPTAATFTPASGGDSR